MGRSSPRPDRATSSSARSGGGWLRWDLADHRRGSRRDEQHTPILPGAVVDQPGDGERQRATSQVGQGRRFGGDQGAGVIVPADLGEGHDATPAVHDLQHRLAIGSQRRADGHAQLHRHAHDALDEPLERVVVALRPWSANEDPVGARSPARSQAQVPAEGRLLEPGRLGHGIVEDGQRPSRRGAGRHQDASVLATGQCPVTPAIGRAVGRERPPQHLADPGEGTLGVGRVPQFGGHDRTVLGTASNCGPEAGCAHRSESGTMVETARSRIARAIPIITIWICIGSMP